VRWAVNQRANRLLPVEAFVDEVAFEIIATGEAKKVRLHRGHHFDEIGAVAIGPIVEGGGNSEISCSQTVPGFAKVISR
jgi:hypothetical protein